MTDTEERSVSSLQDLADIAGVSRATASRALRDSPLVNARTRKKLQALAGKYNYTVNKQARDFRLRRTSVISVVFMLDPRSEQHMSDPFFLEMLGGIADGLAAHDYDLLLAHAPVASVLELASSRIVKHADGVIFIGQGEEHDALNELASRGTPVVVWGGPVEDKRYVLVGGDNVAGNHAATSHLLELGRRRIAFFGNTRTPENVARFRGYEQALTEFGIGVEKELIVNVPSDMPQAQRAVSDAMDAGIDIDAVVCTSDVMAIATISAFSGLGLKVPADIAVVGYDNISLAAYSSPPLTTVRQNIQQAGSILVESVLGLINGERVTDSILPSELIVRKSSGM